jgi:tetratricopeptide (TPR) repeat protein
MIRRRLRESRVLSAMLFNQIRSIGVGSSLRSWRPDVSFRQLVSLGALGVASLVLWLAIGPSSLHNRLTSGSHTRSGLVAALGTSRLTAGRLRGFPCCPQAVASENGRALSQLGRSIERELNAKPSAHTRAELALVKLAGGKPEEAVRLLETAVVKDQAEKAQNLNDLSVAYLARAEAFSQPRDIALALNAAIMAIESDSDLPEACFNRALALERLHLVIQAAAAWRDCAGRETDPDWKAEEERHLAGLRRSPNAVDVEGALRRGDDLALEDALTKDQRDVRREALERILPAWGAAYLAGREAEANTAVARGRLFGRILVRRDHDFMVAEVFEGIARETGRPVARPRLKALAQAGKLYGEARRGLETYRKEESLPLFEKARDFFAQAGNPLEAWAELGAIGCEFYRDDFDVVFARLEALKARVDLAQFPALAGQWYWIKGMAHSRQGDLRASLREFETTVAYFETTGDRELLGAGYQLVGEMYRLLGDEDEAWSYRIKGLALLRSFPTSRRRLMVLRDASESLLAGGSNRAALAFQTEAVQAASWSAPARDLTEMLLWRAQALTKLGRFEGAKTDLKKARSLAARIEDSDLQERSLADVGFTEADLESQRNPESALPLFDEPEAAYRKKGHILPLSVLYLHRARLERALQLPDRESADLIAGIELFERQWKSLDAEKDRVSFLETSTELFDELVVLEIEHGNSIAALEYSERARAFWTGSPGSVDASWVRSLVRTPWRGDTCPEDRRTVLPPDVVVLEYAVAGDHVYVWLLRCDGMRFAVLPIGATRLAQISGALRKAARANPPELGRFKALAETAYDALLRKVAGNIPARAILVVVPDKSLRGIPFAALRDRDSGHYLIENHEIAYAPSATFLKTTWGRSSLAGRWDDVLLVSPLDPLLKESEKEIQDLGGLYPEAEVLAGRDANRDAFLSALDRHRVLHYAGHAEVHSSNPFQSRLPLASADGSEGVTVRDLQGRSFKHLDLVVLSACASIAGTPTRTGGFLGLARPFLSGGVRSVVGTLWDIDDAASRAVLVAFHRKLIKGLSPAAALREAQCEYLGKGWRPSEWAAFSIIGDGGDASPLLN